MSGWDAGGLLATLMQNVGASFGDLLERGQSNQLIVRSLPHKSCCHCVSPPIYNQ